jgi:hypothetical protein
MIPLLVFALVVLIVAIASVAKIHDQEIQVHWRLHAEELEHQRKMLELEEELQKLRQGH